MSFIRCSQCGWEQDDWWDQTYNPLEALCNGPGGEYGWTWQSVLLEVPLDILFGDGPETVRERIAQECERTAAKIRAMRWRTKAGLEQQNPEGRCPRCGAVALTEVSRPT